MANSQKSIPLSTRDFHLVPWGEDTPESELRSAFRRKWDWVVSDSVSSAGFHAMVIGNLEKRYVPLECATVDMVRNEIMEGLKKDAFVRLKSVMDVSGDALSKVVGIPSRTLSRREEFKPDESDRILRVASAFQQALQVLGSLEDARRWFHSPKRALGGKTPLEYCDTEPGAEEVENLLGRIEHGVFS